ncbi:hypothetical protein [Nibribacter koreensis]|uniref:YD repeat-containing protein n=1 Tax=Nibribacter koreensis TaxID=1084519 RepID=A0ABP8FIQ5_9BACT
MKSVFYISILLFTILTISCKEDTTEEVVPQILRLTKMSETSPIYDPSTHLFKYNQEGKLIEYNFQPGRYVSNEVDMHSYNSQGQLSEILSYDTKRSSSYLSKTTHTYNASNQLIKLTRDESGSYYAIDYNSQGNISEIRFYYDGSTTASQWYILEYDSRGNMTSQKTYRSEQGKAAMLSQHSIVEYDDKPNPFHKLGSPLLRSYGQNSILEGFLIGSLSPNNPTKVELRMYLQQSGQVMEWVKTINYLYKYGAGNLPIEITYSNSMGVNVQTLEYAVQ